MNTVKVLIPTKLDTVAADLLKAKGYIVVQEVADFSTLAAQHADASVLIVRSEKVTEEVLNLFPALKLVVRAGAGYDNIDIQYARRKGIDVMNTPGANANAVAEEVVAVALAAYRHVVPADISTRQGLWEKNKFMGRELTGKTVGIVGLGNIGQLVAKRVSGFDCNVIAYDPVIAADLAQHIGVELVTLDDLFARADLITLHIPETDATRGMVNKARLLTMKDGSMLINCARAGVINESDLREVKAQKKLIYCNDVYPKDAEGEKSIADVADIMLPHLGASTLEANANAARRSATQTIAYFQDGVTTFVVNKNVPDGLNAQYQKLASILAKYAHKYLGEGQPLHRIELTLYGKLNPFFDWMISPIADGIFPEFDPYQDAGSALNFLKMRGISIVHRTPDNRKCYGESITLDLYQGSNPIHKISLRGTITENQLMISRVNDFENLYHEPMGNNLMVEYDDQVGIIGKIAGLLGKNNINIIDIRAPHNISANRSLAVIKTNHPVPDTMIPEILEMVQNGKVAIVNT